MAAFTPDTDYPIDVTKLPKNWRVTNVGTVVGEVRRGFYTARHNDEGLGVPHLRPMNIARDGTIALHDVKYVEAPTDLRIQRGDILFNNTNSAELVGKTAVFNQDGDWTFSNHMTRLRVPSSFSPEFIAYQFLFLWREGYFRKRSTQHVSQASINSQTLIETVPLVVAPVKEQVAIAEELARRVSRLKTATAAVENARERLREYEKLVTIASATGRLVATDADLSALSEQSTEDGHVLLARLIQDFGPEALENSERSLDFNSAENQRSTSEPAVLPPGWALARVEQVGKVTIGRQRSPQHHSGENMRPYLRVANVFEDRIDISDVLEMNFTSKEFETYKLEYGDILLNEGQSPELVGRPAMFRSELPGACFQNTLIRFRAHPGVSPGFALLVFRAYLHLGRFRAIAKWTTNIAHLGGRRFAQLDFPLPPLAEQERIVTEASRRLDLADALKSQLALILERIDEATRMALARAFSGNLVPAQDGDSDALELLDKDRSVLNATDESHGSQKESVNKMSRTPGVRRSARRPLAEVLAAAERPLTPEELLAESGIGEDLIEEFFAELKNGYAGGRISQFRDGQGNILLQTAE